MVRVDLAPPSPVYHHVAVAIPIALSAVLSGASAAAAGATAGSVVLATLVGAAVGSLGLLKNKGPSSQRKHNEVVVSTSIRNTPVAVCYGRARTGGNAISVGNAWVIKDRHDGTPGRRLKVLNEVIGLCEGPAQAAGNIRQDGQFLRTLAREERYPVKSYYSYEFISGTNAEGVPARVANAANGYLDDPKIPWRNTAKLAMHTIVGEFSRLPDVNCDMVGPDLTVRRSGSCADTADTTTLTAYDGYTESFVYVLSTGLVRLPRGQTGRVLTAKPAAFGGTLIKGWYLGRHDLIVLQDGTDNQSFWLGYEGISAGSSEWEKHTPKPEGGGSGYENDIIRQFIDEQHGILHSLHCDGTKMYLLRWVLLTGRAERLDLTLDPTSPLSYLQILYSPDLNLYAIAGPHLYLIDPDSGETLQDVAAVTTTDCKGLCVSGVRIGTITPSGLVYYDPFAATTSGTLGSSGSGFTAGEMGCSYAAQNSWTGHVTLTKSGGWVNFLPSVVEPQDDISALGSKKAGGTAIKEFQTFPTPSNVTDWVRDWSTRTPTAFDLVLLQGNSSLAAALWATMVDEANLDSGRWGAGLAARYFSLSSFEHVHWFCVGGIHYEFPAEPNADGTTTAASTGYAERAKFDFLLDTTTSTAQVVSDEMLASIQGWRSTDGRQVIVGVAKPGCIPVWHVTEQDVSDDTMSLGFLDRNQGVNRVRVQYRKVKDEYRFDFSEANDEFDQNARGRIRSETLNLQGISRHAHADWLAKQTLDLSTSVRRQADWKNHFAAYMLRPGTPVAITHYQTGLARDKFRVMQCVDGDNRKIQITAQEQRPVLESVRRADVGPPGGDGGDTPNPEDCARAETELDGTIVWFSFGSAYQTGTYYLNYVGGAYKDATYTNAMVHGIEVVTRDSGGTIVVLDQAPHATPPAPPGYDDADAAETANAGQTLPITITSTAPIGIRITSTEAGNSPELLDDGSPAPMFELCARTMPGSGPFFDCIVTAYNTGAESAPASGCDTDSHWTYVEGSVPARITLVPTLTLPELPWVSTPGARWISSDCDSREAVASGATRSYRTTINVPVGITSVDGECAFDNYLDDILVNGSSTGISSTGTGGGTNGWDHFFSFSLGAAQGITSGSNTVTFVTRQIATPPGLSNNPHGLIVKWTGGCTEVGGDTTPECDCDFGIPDTATVSLAGLTMCTSCFASADNTASAHVVSGSADGTYTLDRYEGTCSYRGIFAGPTAHIHCSSNNCNEADSDTNVYTKIYVSLSRLSAGTWRISAYIRDESGNGPSTAYYDNTFSWPDACTGGTASSSNDFTSCTNPHTSGGSGSCPLPDMMGHGGTAAATLDY